MADIPVNASDAVTLVTVTVNGQLNFDFDFRADFLADLKAEYRPISGDPVTVLVGGVDFTASGLGTAGGGTITLVTLTTAVIGDVLAIYRDITVDRLTDYQQNLFARDLNAEQDRIFMILQELVRDVGQTIRVPLGFDGTAITPEPQKVLGWGDDLTLQNFDATEFLNGAEIPTIPQVIWKVPSFAAAPSEAIPASVSRVYVEFYAPNPVIPATLVGGSWYARVGAEPGHAFKFNNGGWWEIAEITPNIQQLGATTDAADNLAAINAAGLFSSVSKRKVLIPPGTFNVNGVITLRTDMKFQGSGAKKDCIIKNVATANGDTFTGNNIDRAELIGFTIDGGRSGSHVNGWPVRLINSRDCRVINCYFPNSPSESVLIRDGSARCHANFNEFEIQGNGAGHIYFLNGGTNHKAIGNYIRDSVGGCIWLSGEILHTEIVGNWCDHSRYELIGVRYSCDYGTISHNRSEGSGDNGISVTGSGWNVFGNICQNGDHNGIGIYGNNNTVYGNQCRDNGLAGGSQYAGIMLHAAFGGLCQNNNIYGNMIERRFGAAAEQQYGIRALGLSYTAWVTATPVTAGTFVYNAGKLYEAQNSATTGATAPAHTSGIVSDGNVNWKYCGTTTGAGSVPRVNNNQVRDNVIRNEPIEIGDGSGDTNNIDMNGTFTPVVVGGTAAGAGTYTQQIADYRRKDNEVSFYIGLAWSAHSGTGDLKIQGLPFPAKFGYHAVVDVWINGLLWGGARLQARIVGGTSEVTLTNITDGGSVTNVAIDASATIQVSGKYLL